jgi:hypothetical protein
MYGISVITKSNQSPIVIEDSDGTPSPGRGCFGGDSDVLVLLAPTVTILERISKENMDKQLDNLFASLSQQENENLPGNG